MLLLSYDDFHQEAQGMEDEMMRGCAWCPLESVLCGERGGRDCTGDVSSRLSLFGPGAHSPGLFLDYLVTNPCWLEDPCKGGSTCRSLLVEVHYTQARVLAVNSVASLVLSAPKLVSVVLLANQLIAGAPMPPILAHFTCPYRDQFVQPLV